VQKAYGDDRRTQISTRSTKSNSKISSPTPRCLITVSHAGYIKRTAADTYRHQSREVKPHGARTKEEDFVEYLFVASAHSYILLFTSKAGSTGLKFMSCQKLPRPRAVKQFPAREIPGRREVTALVAARNLEEAGQFVFMATRNGTVKKSALTEFSNPRSPELLPSPWTGRTKLIGAKLTAAKKMISWPVHEASHSFPRTEVRPMVAALAASTAWISTRRLRGQHGRRATRV